MVRPPSPTPQLQEMVLPMVLQPHLRLILLLTKTSPIRPHIRHHSQAFRVLIPLLQGVIPLPKGAIRPLKGVILLLLQDLVGIPLLRTLLLHQGTEDLPPVIFVHLSFLTLWIRNNFETCACRIWRGIWTRIFWGKRPWGRAVLRQRSFGKGNEARSVCDLFFSLIILSQLNL